MTDDISPQAWSRENYKKWPWASFLIVALSIGVIFVLAASPQTISRASGVSLALSIGFLTLGTILLIPSLIAIVILIWIFIASNTSCRLPECIKHIIRVVNHKPLYDDNESKRQEKINASDITASAATLTSAMTLSADSINSCHTIEILDEGCVLEEGDTAPRYASNELVLNIDNGSDHVLGKHSRSRVMPRNNYPNSEKNTSVSPTIWTVSDNEYRRQEEIEFHDWPRYYYENIGATSIGRGDRYVRTSPRYAPYQQYRHSNR